MKAPSKVRRNCQCCGFPYEIPLIRQSRAREKTIICFPCPNCGFSQCDPDDIQKRCTGCRIPFSIVKHHANGNCRRCYNALWRHEREAPGYTSP
jgi:hypothetical protein